MASAAAGAGADAPGCRLMILKMQVENFKSYGGTKEIGPFHKSFSSVVGPNGSGKSNVIDAMLFVFGKKTSKLRLNKLSELIHKSAEYPDLEYARVTVFFQEIFDKPGEEDAYEVVPGSQFTVSRVAHKDNSSTYYLNGKKSSFGDVTALLKGKGIDLDHNRFLILQGEVELISQMKPKASAPGEEGLLEYLEDIIGSNKYVSQIEEQAKAVEVLTEQRADRIKRLQVADKEKQALASAKEEAEALQAKDREILRVQGQLAQAMMVNARATADKATARLTGAKATRDETKAKLAEAEASGAGLEAKVKSAESSYKSALESHESAKAAMAKLEAKDAELKEEARSSKQAAKTAEAIVNKEAAALEAAKKAGADAAAAIPKLESEVVRLKGELGKEQANHATVMASLKGETEALTKKMDEAQAELGPKAEAHAAAESALETTKNELRVLRERVEAGSRAVAALKEQEAKLGKDEVGKANEKAAAVAELNKSKARRAAIDAEIAAAEANEASTQSSLEAAKARRDDVRQTMKETDGAAGQRNPVAEALAKAALKGGPLAKAGLHGRLGGLGVIDDKYDVAVTTACGQLGTLVVDTVAGAQECVNYLRDHNLGRAKLMMLDKIGPEMAPHMDRKVDTPEGVPRLFDLIRPTDAKFRTAFYFALRDTLVANDLDQARRIAFPKDPNGMRWRVVTLKGELLELTGTMSGGGSAPRRGGMTTTSQAGKASSAAAVAAAGGATPELLAGLEKEVAGLEAALKDIRARRSSLKSEALDLDKALPKLTSRIGKLDMELANVAKMREELAGRIANAAKEASSAKVSADDEAAVRNLSARVASLEADEARARQAASEVEVRATALKRQISEAGGEKVRRADALLKRAQEALAAVERELSKAQAEVKGSEKAAAKAQAAMDTAKTEAEEAAKKHGKAKEAVMALGDEGMPIMEAMGAADAKAKEAEALLAKARAEVEGFTKGLRGLKTAEADAATALAEAEAAHEAASKKLSGLTRRLDGVAKEYKAAMEDMVRELAQAAEEMGETNGAPAAGGDADGDDAMGQPAAGAGASSSGSSKAGEDSSIPAHVLDKIKEPLTLPILSPEEAAGQNAEKLAAMVSTLEAEKDQLKKKVNMAAIAEYRVKEREYLKRVAELEATSTARDNARRVYEGLRKTRLDTFMEGFSRIGLKLKEMYQMITLGGDAELELEDSLDPFEGIRFSVRPPKKSWKAIANLSGGEKTLSSLALVFALHHYKPTPLYVMDEIDAALDFKNVSIVANYIKERTKNAQFIIISLRNNMFELADRLVGIYKTADVTKSVTINPKAIAAACGVLSGQENYGPGAGAGSSGAAGGAVGEEKKANVAGARSSRPVASVGL